MEAPEQIGGLAQKVAARFFGSRLHELKFEEEGFGFAAAFGGGVVFAVEQIEGAAVDIGVIFAFFEFGFFLRDRRGDFFRTAELLICVTFVRGSWLLAFAAGRHRIGLWGFFLICREAGFEPVFPGAVALD